MAVAVGPRNWGQFSLAFASGASGASINQAKRRIVWLSNSGVGPGRNRPPQALLNATGSPDARLRPVGCLPHFVRSLPQRRPIAGLPAPTVRSKGRDDVPASATRAASLGGGVLILCRRGPYLPRHDR